MFIASMPHHIVLHWDGKVLQKKRNADERICIIGRFPGIEEGGVKKPDQLFDFPTGPNSKGRVVTTVLLETIQEWNIPASAIIGGIPLLQIRVNLKVLGLILSNVLSRLYYGWPVIIIWVNFMISTLI